MTFNGKHLVIAKFVTKSLSVSGSTTRKMKDIETQRKIVLEYRAGVRGCGAKALAKKYGLSPSGVRKIVGRAKRRRGDPGPQISWKRRKLSKTEERRICTHLDKHPDATNEQLAKLVQNKISPQNVSNVLARASPPFTRKKFVDQEPEEFTDDWKSEARGFIRKVKKVSFARRVYGDETGIFSNDAPRFGRCRVGKKLFRKRKRRGKKYTLHVFAHETYMVYWTLRDKNANDAEVCEVTKRACKNFEKDDVLLWDMLGRSGRAKNPKAQHFNPSVIQRFEERGVEVWYLPPKGKYFNPTELLFNDLKSHYIRPAYGISNKEMSKDKLTRIIRNYMNDVAPHKLPGFFRARANGAEAIRLQLI